MNEKLSEKQINEMVVKFNKIKDRERRQWTKDRLFIQKAKVAGIVVSDKEIDEYILAHKK
jgi:hypothetical protein